MTQPWRPSSEKRGARGACRQKTARAAPLEEAEQTAREKAGRLLDVQARCASYAKRSPARLPSCKAGSTRRRPQKAYSAAGRVAQLISGGSAPRFLCPCLSSASCSTTSDLRQRLFWHLQRRPLQPGPQDGVGRFRGYAGLDTRCSTRTTAASARWTPSRAESSSLASLSLAFGLSGRRAELFGRRPAGFHLHRRGFGSLDQDTLDTAMAALYRTADGPARWGSSPVSELAAFPLNSGPFLAKRQQRADSFGRLTALRPTLVRRPALYPPEKTVNMERKKRFMDFYDRVYDAVPAFPAAAWPPMGRSPFSPAARAPAG